MKCPCCSGKGKLESKLQRSANEKRLLAIKLRRAGLTFKEIQNALGHKSPNSVSRALKILK